MSEEFSLVDCCIRPYPLAFAPAGVELPKQRQAARINMDKISSVKFLAAVGRREEMQFKQFTKNRRARMASESKPTLPDSFHFMSGY